jgi:hypothetical protein
MSSTTVGRRMSDFSVATVPRRKMLHVPVQATGCKDRPCKSLNGDQNAEQVYKATRCIHYLSFLTDNRTLIINQSILLIHNNEGHSCHASFHLGTSLVRILLPTHYCNAMLTKLTGLFPHRLPSHCLSPSKDCKYRCSLTHAQKTYFTYTTQQ